MSVIDFLNLQLFAEGAEGGTGEAEASTGGDDIPSSIPPRARETYRKAMAQHKPVAEQPKEEAPKPQEQRRSYADLIKSDEYKEEHQAYMDKTIGERLKKYKGLEERQNKSNELLSLVASKYNLDESSESFLDDLKSKIESDDSLYEQYAMDHDISTEEARRIVSLERKVKANEAAQRMAEAERQEAQRKQESMERWNRLNANAERTKAQFPNFNLEAELKDERFVRLCANNNDDTTAAYIACHWNDIMNRTAQTASQQAQIQTANAIASGKSRPIENGLSSQPATVVNTDYSKMNLKQIREAAEQMRLAKR